MEEVRTYARLKETQQALKAELEEVNRELATAEAAALRWFETEGVDHIKVEGRTFYLRRDRYAGRAEGVSPAQLAAELQARGFEDYAPQTPSMQRLRSLLIERDDEGLSPVPEELKHFVVMNETYKVGSRRS